MSVCHCLASLLLQELSVIARSVCLSLQCVCLSLQGLSVCHCEGCLSLQDLSVIARTGAEDGEAGTPQAASEDSHILKPNSTPGLASNHREVGKGGPDPSKGTVDLKDADAAKGSSVVSFSLKKSANKVTPAVAAFTPDATDQDEAETETKPRTTLSLLLPSQTDSSTQPHQDR